MESRGSVHDKGNTAQHHSELTVVDLPVTILVHSRYHLLYLSQADLAGNILKDKLQFIRGNTAVLVFTEHSETLLPQSGSTGFPLQPAMFFYFVFGLQVSLATLLQEYLAKLCEAEMSGAEIIDYFVDFYLVCQIFI